MSAPGQGDAAQNGQAQGEAQVQPQQGEQLQQFGEQFQQLQSGMEDLRSWLQSEPWSKQEEPQQEAEPELDLSFLDPTQGYEMDPQQMAQRFASAVEQAADRRVQDALKQHIQPLQQQVQEQRIEQAARDLAAEFPELENEQTATEVVNASRVMAEQLGQPELAGQPSFWRLVYMAGRAAEHANAEGADAPNAAHVESGNGAAPVAQTQQADMASIFGLQPDRDPVPWR